MPPVEHGAGYNLVTDVRRQECRPIHRISLLCGSRLGGNRGGSCGRRYRYGAYDNNAFEVKVSHFCCEESGGFNCTPTRDSFGDDLWIIESIGSLMLNATRGTQASFAATARHKTYNHKETDALYSSVDGEPWIPEWCYLPVTNTVLTLAVHSEQWDSCP
jgi:hypothetical protein